jgi:hypothetical protein
VVPRGDGYGPFPSLTALSLSLGAQCERMVSVVQATALPPLLRTDDNDGEDVTALAVSKSTQR